MLSASSLNRARRCPPSHALPQVREDSDDARRGTAVHKFLEALANGEVREDALNAVQDPEAHAWCSRIDPRTVPVGGETEVALIYNCATDTAERRPVKEHRGYGVLAPFEVPGTLDLVLWHERPLRVVDWKTAAWDLDPKAVRPQLEFQALAAARVEGADAARAEVRVVSEDGTVSVAASWELDWEDLDRVAGEVTRDYERVSQARAERAAQGAAYAPDVHRGSWCRYCPAWRACPAVDGAVQRMLTRDVPPADALGEAYLDALASERAAEAVRAIARERVKTHGAFRAGDKVLTLDAAGRLRLR